LCVIDGDGNIFQPELIALGNAGGSKAAIMLTQGILSHLDKADNSLAGRAKIWLNIYCNLFGLQEILIKNDVCTAEQFGAFVVGFNQSSPLFSIVNVGPMKEAADAKLKGAFNLQPSDTSAPVINHRVRMSPYFYTSPSNSLGVVRFLSLQFRQPLTKCTHN
jgi:hypothetical protein